MEINRDAPATASAETLIRAPLDRIWAVLTDIEQWTEWNPAVTRVEMRGPLTPGTVFRWKAGGLPVVSTLREVEPKRHLAWTGRSLTIRAIHVWTLAVQDEGVCVRTEESFDGLIVRLLAGPMQRMLATSLEEGLSALKAECERRAAG
jgi:hypothetical protein